MNSWTEPLEQFRTLLSTAGQTGETIRVTLGHLNRFARAHPEPWAVTSADTDAFLRTCRKPGTANRAATALRAFYSWALEQGRTVRNPAPEPYARWSKARDRLPEGWSQALADWQTHTRAAGITEGTVKHHKRYLHALARIAPDPFAARQADLLAFLGSAPDWAPETRRGAHTALRAFYRWASESDPPRIERDPAAGLPRVHIPATVPRPAPAELVAATLAKSDARIRLAVLLGRLAGLRRAEIAGLHVDHVQGEDLRITGKGGRTRVVPLHPDLAAALAPAVAAAKARGDGWLFPRLTPRGKQPTGQHITPAHLGKIVSRALGAGWSPHKLRHAAATAWYSADRDLLAVQQLLGHSSPSTTQRYVVLPDNALRAAVLRGGFTGSTQ
jgi:integrase